MVIEYATRPDHPWLGVLLVAAALLGVAPPSPSAADEDPVPKEAEPRATETLAVIRGRRVNVRVGPRVDLRPVTQLDDGAVLIVVERAPGWLGVRIPEGFPAAVSARYVTAVGRDAVRVEAHNLNLRVQPPEEGRPMPGAFRDRPVQGALLPLIRREEGWVWVLAPESIRAYVSEDYVRELGPPDAHEELLEAARAKRRERVRRLREERSKRAAETSGETLRKAIGIAQQALYRLRLEGGHEITPVVAVTNALDKAIEGARLSPVPVRKLARALRQDLEAEVALRRARRDAEIARLRGLEPKPEKTPAPKRDTVTVRGEIRWEPAPTWRNGGAYVLWADGEPTHVLRLTVGMPLPMPDLKGNAGKGPRTIEGRQPGERVFGLPVVEVRGIKP